MTQMHSGPFNPELWAAQWRAAGGALLSDGTGGVWVSADIERGAILDMLWRDIATDQDRRAAVRAVINASA